MRGFKFAAFDGLCADLSDEELQLKWQHYTRALTSASTSTTVAILAAGPTGGVSMIGAMIAGPLLHNARKKRAIVGRHMLSRGLEPETRSKDIYVPLAIGSAVGAATMGLGSVGAEALAVDAIIDKTVGKVVLHTALDVAATAGEEKHLRHEHRKEQRKRSEGLLLRPSRSFVQETQTDTEYKAAVPLRPSRSFVVDCEYVPYRPEPVQQQLSVPPSFVDGRYSDSEYTMVGALRSSSSVAHWDDQVYEVPQSQRDQNETSVTSSRAVMEKYPLVWEYITSSNVTGQSSPIDAGGDASMFSGLFESFDEDTLEALERDLEQAVEDMDTAGVNPFEDDANIAPPQKGRTFEEPSDLDNLVRRHSVRYTSKINRRSEVPSLFMNDNPSVIMEEAPPAYYLQEFAHRPECMDEKSTSARQYENAGSIHRSNSTSSLASYFNVSDMPPPSYEHLRHPSTVSAMSTAPSSYHRPSFSSASSVSTMSTVYGQPSSHSRTKPEYAASQLSASSWTSRATSSIYDRPEKDSYDQPISPRPKSEYARSDYSTTDSESSRTSTVTGKVSREYAPSEYPAVDSESAYSTTSRTSSIASRASRIASRVGSVASSTNQGLAKTKYLGLETATKVAVGGSLCLMGIRPSVQRKMLEKGKGKLSQAWERRHADDDYREYA